VVLANVAQRQMRTARQAAAGFLALGGLAVEEEGVVLGKVVTVVLASGFDDQPLSKEEELANLKAQASRLETAMKNIQQRINDIDS